VKFSGNLRFSRETQLQKMHDFCFTIPCGLVLVGGVFGYIKKGSTASLAGGVGIGLVLLVAGSGYLSLDAFKKRKNSYLALILETGIVCSFSWVFEVVLVSGMILVLDWNKVGV
jgi:tetrahydromethanopterin S-methyltransferase subunit D